MAELADAMDLGSITVRRAGSSPVTRTMNPLVNQGVSAFLGSLVPPPYPPPDFCGAFNPAPGRAFRHPRRNFFCCFFILPESLKKVLHPIGTLPVHRLRHMGVAIQGESCGIVTGILLDSLHVVPCTKGIYDIRVPQIVETMGFQSGIRQNFLKDLPNCRLRQMTAVRMREDQIRETAIVQVTPRCLLLRKLLGFILLEHIHHKLRRSQRPRLVVLQSAVLEFSPFYPRLDQLLGNPDQPVFKIYAILGEP